jgi:hypothetical protein
MENNDEYKSNHIEETMHKIGTPNEDETEIEYDDSFLSNEDKKKLIECILSEVKKSPNNAWCDEVMINCLAMYKYKQTIINMDIEAYNKEKEQINNDPLSILKS